MSEIIQIFIGQSGCNISQSVTELLSAEHHLQNDGSLKQEFIQTYNEKKSVVFQECKSGIFRTRNIVIDLDPDPINEIKKGSLRLLFSQDNLISAKEDAQSIYTYGAYNNNETFEKTINQLRKEIEKCSNLMGFIVYFSSQGGCSGFAQRLLERIPVDYSKKILISFVVQSSKNFSNVVVEPYNHIATLECLMNHGDLNIMVDNESMYNIYKTQFEMEYPSFRDINHYIAQVTSSVTLPMRFPEPNGITLVDLGINLVPFPRMKFIIPSLGENILVSQKYSDYSSSHDNIQNMALSCLNSENSLLNVDLNKGKYMSCLFMYRGDIQMKNAINQMNSLKNKKKINFVDWQPNGFKIGTNSQKITELNEQSLARCDFSQLALINHSSYKDNIHLNELKYDRLFQKRAFVHWFIGIGIRSSSFNSSRYEVAQLYQDYVESIL